MMPGLKAGRWCSVPANAGYVCTGAQLPETKAKRGCRTEHCPSKSGLLSLFCRRRVTCGRDTWSPHCPWSTLSAGSRRFCQSILGPLGPTCCQPKAEIAQATLSPKILHGSHLKVCSYMLPIYSFLDIYGRCKNMPQSQIVNTHTHPPLELSLAPWGCLASS